MNAENKSWLTHHAIVINTNRNDYITKISTSQKISQFIWSVLYGDDLSRINTEYDSSRPVITQPVLL